MIRFENISKSYEGNPAVKDINFQVEKGELFGLIGPDGAGKSTLFRILTTVLLPDAGHAFFKNRDVVENYLYVRKNIGYMPGKFSLYQDLSVKENLEFFATIFNTTISENYDLIRDIYEQLVPFENRRAGALSGGMKQKLALSCALIHKPEVLVLDEPTFGVDAVSRREFWDMLKSLKEKGVTILVSTPYMDEAALCDRVALIQDGDILKINTPHGIIDQFDKRLYKVTTRHIYQALLVLENMGYETYSFGQNIHLYANALIDVETLKNHLLSKSIEDVHIEMGKPNIEDCFMDLMVNKKTEPHAG